MEVPVKKQAERGDVEQASDRPYYMPRVDIIESEDGLTVLAALPGVDKDNVSLTAEGGVLSVSGRVKSSLPENADARYVEAEEGDFHRSFRLGRDVDKEKMEASMQDGVLKLFLPKSQWARTKKIEVK